MDDATISDLFGAAVSLVLWLVIIVAIVRGLLGLIGVV
jgi:hypothetical protein